jgi:hypothetical protein
LVGIFDTAVADQLGINAAVGGAIDIFEENPIKQRTDGVARLVGFHRDGSAEGAERNPGAKSQQGQAKARALRPEN